MECFTAAIKAGADAVYAAAQKFGARAYAENFTEDELLRALDIAHLNGKKLYLTVNTVLKNSETEELCEMISPLYEAGLDAAIVQDAGVVKILSSTFPDLALHASTQMTITGTEGVLLLKRIGIKRVVPARELSLDELKDIKDITGMELECFIHGALCYSYSGKCLFSSMAGQRSGNRGRCAQPCRLPYNGSYILSARDIMTLDILPELTDAGITSFKIEGRMKSREYVAAVTGIYRKYLDIILETGGKDYKPSMQDISFLDSLYSRSGHCTGYYHSQGGRHMITVQKPSYSSDTQDDPEKLYDKYATGPYRIGIKGHFEAYVNEPAVLRLSCNGTSVACKGEVVQAARTHPTDEGSVRKQLMKTNDTPFDFDSLVIEAGEDIFIPVGSLNALRRRAIAALKDKMLSGYRKKRVGTKLQCIPHEQISSNGRPLFNCMLSDAGLCALASSYDNIDIITIELKPGNTAEKIRELSSFIRAKGKKFYISLPPVIRRDYFTRNGYLRDLIGDLIIDGIITDNYEGLYFFRDAGFTGTVIADMHLYVMNDHAALGLYEYGADAVTYSPELNAHELTDMNIAAGEFILYGRTPMMISAQCTERTTAKCLRDNGISHITDRLGNIFPCIRNCGECFNIILNCVPTMISLNDLPAGFKPYSYRIHLTVEDKENAGVILGYYNEMAGGTTPAKPDIKFTYGHLKRGAE